MAAGIAGDDKATILKLNNMAEDAETFFNYLNVCFTK